MTTYAVEAMYHAGTCGKVTFPEGKTWDDVEYWHVKWDCLHVKFKESTQWFEFDLSSSDSDTDRKYPLNVSVYSVDEDGDVDYGSSVAEV